MEKGIDKQHTSNDDEAKQTLSSAQLALANEWRAKIRPLNPFLAELNDPIWLEVLARTTNVHIKPNQFMFTDDHIPDERKLILEGTIRVFQSTTDGSEITLFRVQPGDLCFLNLGGTILSTLDKFVSSTEMSIAAVSDTDVSALLISLKDYDRLITESKTFRDYVQALSRKRIFQLVKLVGNSVFMDIDLRLADYLLQMIEKSQGDTIEITHFRLAQELGTSREVVSRALERFKKMNYVRLERGRIKLVSQPGLRSLVCNPFSERFKG